MHLKQALLKKTATDDPLQSMLNAPAAAHHSLMEDQASDLSEDSAITAGVGAAGGSLLGAGLGGTLGAAAVWALMHKPTGKDYALGGLTGAGMGGALGGVTGAVVGGSLPGAKSAAKQRGELNSLPGVNR